jgi:hypothetical protein
MRPSFGDILERLGEQSTGSSFMVPVAYRAIADCPYALPLSPAIPTTTNDTSTWSAMSSSSSSVVTTNSTPGSSTSKVPNGGIVFVPDVAPPYTPSTSPVALLHCGLPLTLSLDALTTHFEPLHFERTNANTRRSSSPTIISELI